LNEWDGEYARESVTQPADIEDVGAWGAANGFVADPRQAGDDAVDGLDKITAQMSGGEHRPEQQEMCRAVAEALVTRTHLVVQAGTDPASRWPISSPPHSAASRSSWPRRPRRLHQRDRCWGAPLRHEWDRQSLVTTPGADKGSPWTDI